MLAAAAWNHSIIDAMRSTLTAELRRLPRQLAGRWWATALNLVALGLVAGFVPWLVGLSFLDALVVIPFACLSVFFVAILIAGSLAGDAGRAHLQELRAAGVADRGIVVGKALAASLAGWVSGMAMLAAALGTVNALNWHGTLLLPPVEILVAAAALSLAASVLVAGWGALVSLGVSSVASARRTLRSSLMLVIVVCIFAVKRIPGVAGDLTTEGIARKAWIAAVVCAGMAVLLLVRATRKLSAAP